MTILAEPIPVGPEGAVDAGRMELRPDNGRGITITTDNTNANPTEKPTATGSPDVSFALQQALESQPRPAGARTNSA